MPLDRPAYLSPSSLGTFQTCPLQYKLSRIDKLADPPTVPTILGNWVHDTLEDLINLPAEERTLQTAMKLLADQWKTPKTGDDGEAMNSWQEEMLTVETDEAELRDIRWRARWAIENYFKLEDPTALNVGAAETELLLKINGVPIRGYVDRWDHSDGDRISITDYKSGKTPQKRYQPKYFQQLAIYARGMSLYLDKEPDMMSLLFLKFGDRVERKVTPKVIQDIEDTLAEAWEAITIRCDREYFEPTPEKAGPLCNYCSYRSICPVYNK